LGISGGALRPNGINAQSSPARHIISGNPSDAQQTALEFASGIEAHASLAGIGVRYAVRKDARKQTHPSIASATTNLIDTLHMEAAETRYKDS
jgi:hypothetical protein